MISYNVLIVYLQSQRKFQTTVKKDYIVVTIPGSNYHITVFQDQWDNYENVTNMPYHLFHISSNRNDEKCSTYFWVDKTYYRIHEIPEKFFSYNQPDFDFYKSTRSPCGMISLKYDLKMFGRILKGALKIESKLRTMVAKTTQGTDNFL